MFVKIPTYKISADETEETIDMIAVTSNPAIMIKGVKLSAQTQRPAIMQFATDKERMIIAGPALIPDMEIYRNDEDGEYNVVFTSEVVTQLVEKFAKQNGSSFNVEHSEQSAPMFVMEHWIIEDPEMDKSRTFGFTDLPKGTWFVMAKVTDEKFWENEVKKQGKLGFSIEGLLGLKLTKNTMKKEFKKFKNRFNAIRKFDEVDGVTPEDELVTVSADAIAVDEAVVVVDENMEPVDDYTGEVLIDGDKVNITEGVITEVVTATEPEAEVEAAAEPEAEVEPVTEPEEEVEVEAAEVPVTETEAEAGMDEAAIMAIVQPKLDEIYAAIATLQIEAQAPSADVPVELTKMEKRMQALKLIKERVQ